MKISAIPITFILKKVALSWPDILWGHEYGYLNWTAVIKLAEQRLAEGSEKPLEVELAGFTKEQASQVDDLLKELAGNPPKNILEQSKKKWLFIMLSWAYENRINFLDSLETIDGIYADFDYPPEIDYLWIYTPPTDGYDPSKHTDEENEKRYNQKWGKYLRETEKSLTES